MEPRADMLPDASLTSGPDIEPKIDTPTEPVKPVEQVPPKEPEPPKGSKTPDSHLYAALDEERKKRKELEARLTELESAGTVPSEEDMSDEGRALHKEINSLKEEIEVGKVLSKYPDIVREEFDEFRTEYPRTKLENVAKLFRAEKGLLELVPNRPGLEKPTGGPKAAPQKKYTGEDISNMMKNDNRRFQRLVREGKITAEDIESEA